MTEFPELTPEQQARIADVIRLKDLPYDLFLEYPHCVLLMIQYLEGSLVLPEEVEREGYYVHIPNRMLPDVCRLLDYKRETDLGPVEGLDLLLGKNIAGDARKAEFYHGRASLDRCRNGGVKGGKAKRELSYIDGEWPAPRAGGPHQEERL